MNCSVCVATVSQSLKALAGVEATQANPTTGQLTVTLAPGHRLTAADLTRAVENAGYTLDRITPGATVPGKP
jgi:copper chaperone CopZ